MAPTYGPFDEYTEVSTPRGVFGVQSGNILVLPDNKDPVFQTSAEGLVAGDAEPDDVAAVFESLSTTEGAPVEFDGESPYDTLPTYDHGAEGIDDGPEETYDVGLES